MFNILILNVISDIHEYERFRSFPTTRIKDDPSTTRRRRYAVRFGARGRMPAVRVLPARRRRRPAMSKPPKPAQPADQPQPALDLPDPPPLRPTRVRGSRALRGTTADGRIGQTLRLDPAAWEQLKVLAAKERKNAHDLLVEAVNMLFTHRGFPPLA